MIIRSLTHCASRLPPRRPCTLLSLAVTSYLFLLIVIVKTRKPDGISGTRPLETGRTGLNRAIDRPEEADVRRRHEHWQVQSDGDDELVLYSAFYDDRLIVGRLPWLRILGVRKITSQVNRKLFCYVWHSDIDSPYVVEAQVSATGRDLSNAGRAQYGPRLFSCQLPSNTMYPYHVSVAPESSTTLTTLLPVTDPDRSAPDRWQHQFAVCNSEPLHRPFPVEQIVEWIEAYRMFGVTHFGIYDVNITDPLTIDALDWYVRQGLVELRPLPPSVDDYSEEGVRFSSPTSLNDCMMRHMYSSRFVVVVDLDEIIIPRMHDNYDDMLADIDRHLDLNESYHTYSFRNAYFFTYWPQDDTQPAYLRSMRFRHRSPRSDSAFGMFDPRRRSIPFDGTVETTSGLRSNIDVPSAVALRHRYLSWCPFDGAVDCEYRERGGVSDGVMLKFKPALMRMVTRTLTGLGIFKGI